MYRRFGNLRYEVFEILTAHKKKVPPVWEAP
jgi:hypothetical protein